MPSPPPPPPLPFEFRPDLLPQMALNRAADFLDGSLGAAARLWGLIVVRAIFSTVAWLLACPMQSHLAFGVPPIAEGSVGGGYGSW